MFERNVMVAATRRRFEYRPLYPSRRIVAAASAFLIAPGTAVLTEPAFSAAPNVAVNLKLWSFDMRLAYPIPPRVHIVLWGHLFNVKALAQDDKTKRLAQNSKISTSERPHGPRLRGMSNRNEQVDYYTGLAAGIVVALRALLPHVDDAALREHVGPLLKLHADALAKAGAVPANGPKLTRAIVAACERTGIAPADIGA